MRVGALIFLARYRDPPATWPPAKRTITARVRDFDRGYGPRALLKVTDGYGYHVGYFTLAELPKHLDLAQLSER